MGASLSIHLHGQDKGALARLLGIDHHLDADRADGLDDHLCALLERLSLLTVLDDEPALSTDFAGSIHRDLPCLRSHLDCSLTLGSHCKMVCTYVTCSAEALLILQYSTKRVAYEEVMRPI